LKVNFKSAGVECLDCSLLFGCCLHSNKTPKKKEKGKKGEGWPSGRNEQKSNYVTNQKPKTKIGKDRNLRGPGKFSIDSSLGNPPNYRRFVEKTFREKKHFFKTTTKKESPPGMYVQGRSGT